MSFCRCFPSSEGKDKPRPNGFTLIELVVVMALIVIMMFVALPNFEHIFNDDMRETSQWILLQVPKYKAKAVSESQIYALHVDMDNHQLWFSSTSMSEEQMLSSMKKGFSVPDSIHIIDVIYSNGESIQSGDAQICFYPKGYSDKAVLHIEKDGGDRRSFFFEPFLTQVETADGYVDIQN